MLKLFFCFLWGGENLIDAETLKPLVFERYAPAKRMTFKVVSQKDWTNSADLITGQNVNQQKIYAEIKGYLSARQISEEISAAAINNLISHNMLFTLPDKSIYFYGLPLVLDDETAADVFEPPLKETPPAAMTPPNETPSGQSMAYTASVPNADSVGKPYFDGSAPLNKSDFSGGWGTQNPAAQNKQTQYYDTPIIPEADPFLYSAPKAVSADRRAISRIQGGGYAWCIFVILIHLIFLASFFFIDSIKDFALKNIPENILNAANIDKKGTFFDFLKNNYLVFGGTIFTGMVGYVFLIFRKKWAFFVILLSIAGGVTFLILESHYQIASVALIPLLITYLFTKSDIFY